MSDIQQSAEPTNYTDAASIESLLFESDSDDGGEDTIAGAAADDEQDDQLESEVAAEGGEETGEDQDGEGDADDGAEGDGEGGTEEMYVVKINGQEVEVTETELLSGYQRQQDYTQKTQQLASDRRTFEQERQGELQQLQSALSYYALPTAKEPRPEDFAGKPEDFMQAYNTWQQDNARQTEAAKLLEAITADEQQHTLAREAGLLQEAIPEWADETVRQAEYSKMMEAAADRYGFSPEEISSVTDHRIYILLRDAVKGAELDAKPVILKRKTEVKPKMGAGAKVKSEGNAKARKAAMSKLKTQGEVEGKDAETLLFD